MLEVGKETFVKNDLICDSFLRPRSHRTELNSAQALKRNRPRRGQILVARGGVSETNGTPGNAMTTPQNRRGDWFVGDYGLIRVGISIIDSWQCSVD